jgi:hypothetical protein
MRQVFMIIPGSGSIYFVLAPVIVLMLVIAGLMAYLAYSARHVRFEVSADGLRISGDLYGRMIPSRDLIAERARALDLTRESDFALSRRTNGAALPGYRSGWFRLRNGEKALAFVTDVTRVAYVPTRAGYSVLVSVDEPARFVEAVKIAR